MQSNPDIIRFPGPSTVCVCLIACAMLAGCGGSGSSNDDAPAVEITVVIPSLGEISVSGISDDLGNFDPAPTVNSSGGFWISYSHVTLDASGIKLIDTRLANSADAGASWVDSGARVNPATAFPLGADTVAWAQEVSRLAYNPYAAAAGPSRGSFSGIAIFPCSTAANVGTRQRRHD